MKYEEYLREVVKDKDNIEHIHANVSLNYFPFTDQCPVDGRNCKGLKCKKYRDDQCIHFELHRVMYKMFGSGDKWQSFDCLEDEDRWLSWRISYNSYAPEEVNDPDRVAFTIGTDNVTISGKVLREVGLGEYVTDDTWNYSSCAFFPETFESLPKIQEFLELVISKRKEIEDLFVKYHTCVRCKKVSDYDINFYDPIGICKMCAVEITKEWLKDNGFEISESE